MDIMLKLNPQHYEFFYPLVEWKILSVTELYKMSGYLDSNVIADMGTSYIKENTLKAFFQNTQGSWVCEGVDKYSLESLKEQLTINGNCR